ncbi:MAG: LamG domain-containing protein [Pseudomonadota bacterium]
MTKAIGFAARARAVAALVVTGVVLAACGGGAATTDNPQAPTNGNTGNSTYTGPVASSPEVLQFQQEFWTHARGTDRCGSCHNETVGQNPMFVRNDDVNLAYEAALPVIDETQPSQSRIVTKVGSLTDRHNCWVEDPGVCGSIMTTWIENWVGEAAGGGRQIVLAAPDDEDPATLTFSSFPPPVPAEFGQLRTLLTTYCSNCHSSEAATPQQPYFADVDEAIAYEAAKSKINLDAPENSRFVIKVSPPPVGESHNCWNGGDCNSSSSEMLAAVSAFTNSISATSIDGAWMTSDAISLVDGTLASGGNRFEDAQVALWEFKTGNGLIAYDSSGVDPAIDLNFSGDVQWYGGWGITIGMDVAQGPGKAQGSTSSSKKLHDVLVEAGEFSIEAWVVPSNVTQEMARIVTYSGGQTTRNFALQQTLYNYDFLLRTNETSLNGDPQLSTPDADEVLQATLQHVVATYDPINGRSIYVNGALVSNADPVPGGTFVDWQDNFALVLGNEASSDGTFEGTFRLAAVHRRALSQEQIQQNFDAGVGERFYMLFDVSARLGAPDDTSFVLFEAQQFDTYAYLFDKPHFITLDGSTPTGVAIEGMHLAMNGIEVPVGQSYANMAETTDPNLIEELGQPLMVNNLQIGAVIPLEKGPADDVFFLTFDNIAGNTYNRPDDPTLVITPTDLPAASHIGVRTYDEIDAAYSNILGVDRLMVYTNGDGDTGAHVDETFQELRQSLPAIEDINTFLSSHQVAIAQLAIQYCDAAIGSNANPNPNAALFWPGFNFDQSASVAFSSGNRNNFVDPLILAAAGQPSSGTQLESAPTYTTINTELSTFQASGLRPDNLIDRLLAGPSDTRAVAKGVCAAVLGSASTLIQ